MFDSLPRSDWKGTFLTPLALIQICLQGELSCKRIRADVVGIERSVLHTCVERVRLASEICLGQTPFERSQETTRLTARSVRQRYSIPRGVGVLVRSLGGEGQGQSHLLLAARLCSKLGVCAFVGLGDELQVGSTPLLRV